MTTPEDRLRSELAALADVPMPADVAERIARALDAGDGPPVPLRRPGRRRPARTVLPIAAAAVLIVLAGVVAVDGPADAPRTVGREDDLRTTGAVAFGRDGAGAFADPVRRRECLTTARVPEPDAALLGGVPYAVDGTSGTLLVLGTGVAGRYRLVVVDPSCGRVLAQTTAGR